MGASATGRPGELLHSQSRPLQMSAPPPFSTGGGGLVYTAIAGFDSGKICGAAEEEETKNRNPLLTTQTRWKKVSFVFSFFMFYIDRLFFSFSFPPFTLS